MTIRLNKVTRDLNVGISTVVEFLQKKGFAVEANPNTKINEEQYALLVKEFSTDKNLRLESERFIQERQNKDRNKASVSIDGYEAETTEKPKVEEIKTVVPEDARPKFKPVGKIDLDKLNRKPVVEKVEEKKVETSAPVVKEEPKPQPKPEPKPEFRPEPKPEPNPEPQPEPKPEPTTYTVTVIGGTIDGKTSVSAKENDTLTVVLDQNDIPDGMTFDMWSISSSKLSGDINVDYRAEAMTFQMPAEDVTIRAQYRSAEIIEDAAPSPLATAATIAVGGAAAGIVVWQGVSLGVDLYLANALPQGVPVPTDRRALALLLWETAGKPEVALPTLYGDIPAEEIELQKATRWAIQNGLMDAADKKDASLFDPDHYVTKMDVFGAWLRLKKLLGTIGTSPTQ